VALVEGVAGIGKTALCRELAAYVSPRRGDVTFVEAVGDLASVDFARGKPALIVVDALDAPDLSAALETIAASPVLLVVTIETSSSGSGAASALRRPTGVEHVQLRGLSLDDVRRYLRSLMGAELPEALAGAVHGETDGNALFVVELVRYLAEKGHLSLDGDRWEWDGHLPEEVVASDAPPAIVRQRVASLTGRTTAVLAEAARVGMSFAAGDLKGAKRDAVGLALEEAAARHVVEPSNGRFEFGHRLVREALL